MAGLPGGTPFIVQGFPTGLGALHLNGLHCTSIGSILRDACLLRIRKPG